jgi:hypothetical protein
MALPTPNFKKISSYGKAPIYQICILTYGFLRRPEEQQIILTGEPTLIKQLKCQLELMVEQRRKLVLGMEIQNDLHHALLREPEHDIRRIQKEAQVFICFPGKPEYDNLSEPENLLDELCEANEGDIVKIHGNREAYIRARQMLEVMFMMA